MSDAHIISLQYLVIISNHKNKDKFLSLLGDYGARQIDTVYGYGSMSPSALAAAFGLEGEQGRVLISCLIRTENVRELIDVLCDEYHFDKPNTGIVFTIPVQGLTF